jgi:hypothetical protein
MNTFPYIYICIDHLESIVYWNAHAIHVCRCNVHATYVTVCVYAHKISNFNPLFFSIYVFLLSPNSNTIYGTADLSWLLKWLKNNAVQSLSCTSAVSGCMLLHLCTPCICCRNSVYYYNFLFFRWMHMMVFQLMFVDSVWIKLMCPTILKSSVKFLMQRSGSYWKIRN